jgi:predicted tellurium resistance membrane protein TerC
MDIFSLESLIALFTLTSLEVVLGIDNIVFIAIVAARLGPERRDAARVVGLAVAVVSRLLLLLTLTFLASLTAPLISLPWLTMSGRDLILVLGGVFLIYKATKEIHEKTTGSESELEIGGGAAKVSFAAVITQIVMIDLIFSLDSVITALAFSGAIVRFIEANPTVKMLALSFLLMIGFVLVLDGMGHHVQKGYIYFAMAFSLGVELLNLRASKKKRQS